MSDDAKELAKLIIDWLDGKDDEHMVDIVFRHKLYKFIGEL